MNMPLENGKAFAVCLSSGFERSEPEECKEKPATEGEARAETANHELDAPGVSMPPDGLKHHESGKRPAPVREAELERSPI